MNFKTMTITFLTKWPNLPADLKKGLSIATENVLEMSESQRLQFEGGKSFGREKSNQQSSWALGSVIKFLQMTKARVERKEITAATLLNSVKVIKLFCEMNDVLLPWKRITRGLPKSRCLGLRTRVWKKF
jgi:hypothetical protein